MKIKIVADSACDIPPDIVQKYGMGIVAVYINFGAQASYLDDGVQITKEQFYSRLRTANPLPTTAAPPPGEAERVLRQTLEDCDHVIAVHIAHAYSGTLNSSRVAAQNIGGDKVTVFDSETLSMGAGWQAIIAAEAAAAGQDVASILKLLEAAKKRTQLWAVPSTMEYLRRSGRVNSLVAGLGEILDIKPIINVVHSQVVSVARVRTFKKVIPKLVELCRAQAPLERLTLLHIDNLAGAEEMRDQLKDIAPPEHTNIIMAAAAIGANFGPGGLGAVTLRQA